MARMINYQIRRVIGIRLMLIKGHVNKGPDKVSVSFSENRRAHIIY